MYIFQVPWPHVTAEYSFYEKFISNTTRAPKFTEFEDVKSHIESGKEQEALKLVKELDLIRENFLQVSVLIDEAGTVVYEDVPSVNFYSFLGSIGGILNLWIGITFITLVEIIDMLINMVMKGVKGL